MRLPKYGSKHLTRGSPYRGSVKGQDPRGLHGATSVGIESLPCRQAGMLRSAESGGAVIPTSGKYFDLSFIQRTKYLAGSRMGRLASVTVCGAFFVVVSAGCSDDDNPDSGGRIDAGMDAGMMIDGGVDAGTDAGMGMEDGGVTPGLEVVETAEGPVRGTVGTDYISFKGIPYAAPPLGDLRFAPPVPTATRSEELVADEFGGSCVQPSVPLPGFGVAESEEDCLYLNIYRPTSEGSYPVMVWIHGGAFELGSGDSYDPVRLVAQGTVVVTINYRLGILGFLAHDSLSAEGDGTGSGSYGIMDQQAALRWVQGNIEGFGGDPENVTIFGESAGGHSVLTQLVSPSAMDLFAKAIVESGSYRPTQRTLAQAEAQGAQIAGDLGCSKSPDVAACLRAVPVENIVMAQSSNGYEYVPNLRPGLLPASILESLSAGEANDVPVLVGTNQDEWRLFVAIDTLERGGTLLTEDRYVQAIQDTLGVSQVLASTVAAVYPVADYGGGVDAPSLALGALGTDAIFACNSLALAGILAGRVPTYTYEFADRDAPSLLPPIGFDLGAAHAFEIQYIFGSETAAMARGMTPDQIAVSNAMVGYWTAFARDGNPSSDGNAGLVWPGFSTGAFMTFTTTTATTSAAAFAADHRCAFWAEL